MALMCSENRQICQIQREGVGICQNVIADDMLILAFDHKLFDFIFISLNQLTELEQKIKYYNYLIYSYFKSLLPTFQNMGNSSCSSPIPNGHQNDLMLDQYEENTSFQDDYRLQLTANAKFPKKESIAQIKSLGTLTGSKSLKFGFQSPQIQTNKNQAIGKPAIISHIEQQPASKSHLQPIVFSIIEFSANSGQAIYETPTNRSLSEQRLTKLLSSTMDEQGDDSLAQQVALDYILSFVDKMPHIDVNRQQFVRIKKLNIENDYIFKEKMGEGSFGEVYKCEQKRTKQIRAVKILKKSILTHPKLKQQFQQEFSILKKLDHPNILKIFQVYQLNKSICIVSEFCQGNSLASYIKKKVTFSAETKKQILRQLFLGVNYLHHMKIIHRDLKPDNVVFINQMYESTTPDQVDLRIIDFGLAIEENEDIFKDWASIGTYNYMAPEVFEGVYSNKCDSWACGVIMYMLLLNVNPYRGFDAQQVRIKIKEFTPNMLDFKNLEVEAIELMLHLTKVNYVLRWSLKMALGCNYFSQNNSNLNKRHILDKLSSYSSATGLVSVAESYLSFKKTTQEQQCKLGKYFHTINSNRNGIINMEQLQSFFDGIEPEQIRRCFQRIDKNRSGSIDFGQFLVAMMGRRQLFSQSNLRDVFDFIDVGKKGKISKQQIKYFLRSIDKANINTLIQEMSTNDGSFVTFAQFSAYLLKEKWL